MATFKSEIISNLEATPPVLNDISKHGGRVRIAMDNFALSAGVDEDDILHMVKLPSYAVVCSIWMQWSDLASSGSVDIDVGLYNATTGVVVDSDCFGTDISGSTISNTQKYEIILDNQANMAKFGDQLWAFAGETADTGDDYYVSLTIDAAASPDSGAEKIGFRIMYVID